MRRILCWLLGGHRWQRIEGNCYLCPRCKYLGWLV